jgi:DNA processing protein
MDNIQEKLSWLRLARSENVGKSTFFRLIKIFGSPQNAIDHLPENAAAGGLEHKIKIYSQEEAEKELVDSEKYGAKIIIFSDTIYPHLLRKIPNPSPVLTVKGDIELFNHDKIAVVGPRNASFAAISCAKKIALELGQNSIVTVSGLARGVDCAVHEASVLSGTIAVIGGGINHVYPKENHLLYKTISESGLLISENPFNMTPRGWHFIQRNRLISGLSLGLLIVEAGLRSGSLTTAKFAIEQGREVFAIPGSPFDPRCHGANRLIKDGAKMFEDINDILEELPTLKDRFYDIGILREPESDEEGSDFFSSGMPADSEIKKVREEIFSKLSFTPISIEQIIQELKVSSRAISIAIIQLELADKVEVNFGKVALKLMRDAAFR